MRRKEAPLSVVLALVIMFAATIMLTLTKYGDFGIAQGQVNISSLTPEQKSAICASVGSHVNTTESKICGIPKTPSSNATTSSENTTTTGAEAPSADAGE